MNSAGADWSVEDRAVTTAKGADANQPLLQPAWGGLANRVRTHTEFGDLLLFLYLLVLARECFWSVPHNRLAWSLSLPVATLCWIVYVASKDAGDASAKVPLWLVVGLPLCFIYSLRVVFADLSFDVLNHHLFLSERALRGPLLLPGDFFPTPAPYNPAPDMLTGLFRYLLGYRLGTVINLFVLLWVAQVLDKLLRPFVRNNWLRAISVLLCLLAEQILSEVSNYMVDLIALPLTLEATRLALMVESWERYRRRLIRIAFLCGLAVAMKLTNVAMVAPIVLACSGLTLFKLRPAIKSLAVTFALTAAAFFATPLPYCLYIYRRTGSPFFPIYNAILKSPYWPLESSWDPRWGPHGVLEVLAWPVLLICKAKNLSELNVYSGRITIGIVAVVVFNIFCWRRADLRARTLCFFVLLTALFWSLTTGYIRYALHLEALSGAIVIIVTVSLWKGTTRKTKPLRVMFLAVLWLSLASQVVFAFVFILRKDWSGRPTMFESPYYRDSAQYLLHDHSIQQFLTPEEKALYEGVDVWVVSGTKTVGIEALLKRGVPFISVRNDEYFTSERGPERFRQLMGKQQNKRMRSLALADEYDLALEALRSKNLTADQIVDVKIPFFSPLYLIPMKFFEVIPLEPGKRDYYAAITVADQPATMRPGEARQLLVSVKNAGKLTWPWRVQKGWLGIVTAGDRWLNEDGLPVNEVDARVALTHDVRPGEEVELKLTVTAPNTPGNYQLEIDMIHEDVAWFFQRGSPTVCWNVKVE